MRISTAATFAALSLLMASPLAARDQGQGLVIDVKPRSWLDAGKVAYTGQGRDYVTNTTTFGGGPVNGISSRGESNLPSRGLSGGGLVFEFLGANAVR